jgi:hypothetical protein
MTSAIVTSTYHYKRPLRKRKPAAIEGLAIVTSVDPDRAPAASPHSARRLWVLDPL